MISAAIVNFNQMEKLEQCLGSISGFVKEIIILDLGSTDNSKKIAEKFEAKFIPTKFVEYVELLRNTSIEKTSGDWILVLDPDEKITEKLKEKLKYIVKQNKYDAVNIPRKNIFFDKWIAHTNWWPDYHMRFFKKGKVKWNGKIHRYPLVEGEILNLPAKEDFAIEHYGYDSIDEFISRQSRYSSIEAQNLFDLGEKFSWMNFFWRPTREFLVRYIKHLGFLDGFYGFALTFLMMIYQLAVMIKLWEIQRQKR